MADLQAVSLTKQALQQLEDHLTCSICFNPYDKPKLLNCAHIFCQECIQRLAKPVHRGVSSVTCPFCSKETALPQGGVVSLQEAFYLNSLTEIQGTLEKVGGTELEDPIPSAPFREDLNFCSEHQKELDMYCETCSIVICAHCTVKQHRDHQFELKDEKVSKSRDELLAHFEPMNEQLLKLKKEIDDQSRQILDQRSSLETQIYVMTEDSLREMRYKKAKLIDEVYCNAKKKLQRVLDVKEKILSMQGELNSYTSQELLAKGQVDATKVKMTACIQKVAELDLKTSDLSIDLSEMIGRSNEDPIIYATGMELTTAQVGKTSTAIVHVCGKGEWPSFDCLVIPEGTYGDAVSCNVTPISDHRYEITFLPKTKGKNRLHIKVNGTHIIGSPFPLQVTLPVDQIGTPLQVIDGVISPFGIAVDLRGRLVVAEYSVHRVSIYDSGKRVSMFGCYGSGDGEFINPRGVAVDEDGSIFVSDEGNNRLQKFTCDGVFMTSAGSKGTGLLEFSTPTGICYNRNNHKLYVADMRNCRIQVLSSDLSFSHSIGSKGMEQGKLAYPWDVAFDRSGNGYVADTSNRRIQVFSPKGSFLYSINGKNQGKGGFESPSSLAVDDNDILYIADLKNNRIVAYTTDGDFMAGFGELGSEVGKLNLPHGLAINNESGVIYISDLKNKRIQCF